MRVVTRQSVVQLVFLLGTGCWLTSASPLGGCWSVAAEQPPAQANAKFRSPAAITVAPNGKVAYVVDRTAGCIVVLDLGDGKPVDEIRLQGEPCSICQSPDGNRLYVAERTAGTVAVIDTAKRQVIERVDVARRPVSVALAPESQRLFAGAEDTNSIWIFDTSQSPIKKIRQVPAVREPSSIAVTPDEKRVVVTNLLPDGVSTDATLGAVVTVIDGETLEPLPAIKLPPGSTGVGSICISPDGKWAYAVHSLGRFTMPITQLERGWVNTSAMSILDLQNGRRVTSVLLDTLTQGAADPREVVCSPDGKQLWITHSGTHEVTRIDAARLHQLLAGKVPPELADLKDGSLPNIWVRIQKDPKLIAELENDLTALYIGGAMQRIGSDGNGPRAVAITPDGKQVLVGNYFSGTIAVVDAAKAKLLKTISIGPQPAATAARRGEMVFNDATKAFQRWYSCATCHPNRGRVDGLSWDFMRDGIGNPKDTINLVHMDRTPPYNRRATRPTARECARTSLQDGHMLVPTPQEVDDVLAFLKSLEPEPSPYLTADGKLSKAALRGKQLFEGKADCAGCHPGPYYTDLQMHDVGTRTATDPDGRYDTPSLIEPYRTAPYLHDGRARTIKDVLTIHNKEDEHGKTQKLTPQEIDDLATYILSL